MRFSEEVKKTHSRLAAANREFLEYVELHPECLERASFAPLEANLVGYPLQPWPMFLDARALGEIRRVVVSLHRLLTRVPERFFDNDAARLAEFFGESESLCRLISTLIAQPGQLDALLSRGDYIETTQGFQCLEVNLNSNIGGWQTLLWEDLYRATPPLASFLREGGIRIATTDTMRILFDHLAGRAAAAGIGNEGELNLLFAIPSEKHGRDTLRVPVQQAYSRFLEETRGWRGQVMTAAYEEVEARAEKLYLGGLRVHVVVEHYGSFVPPEILVPMLSGQVLLLNGPVSRLLNDRRTLALLSEYQESDLFDAEERAVIRGHVPWTRFVARDFTDYRGERVFLPELLVKRRERLVLKHVASARGDKVLFGAGMPLAAWETVAGTALSEGKWIVQELVDSVPYWRQTGATGCAAHDLVWGFFAFGDRYGGGFLRMRPSGAFGAINSAQGAEESILFEVEPAPTDEMEPGNA